VDAALAASPALRESLAAFTALEDALVSRRALVPPAERFLRGVFATARAAAPPKRRARSRVQRWFDAAVSLPAVTAYVCLTTAIAAFVYRDAVARLVARLTEKPNVPAVPSLPDASGVTNAIVAATGGEMWVLSVVYGGVTLLIVLTLSLVTTRFARERR